MGCLIMKLKSIYKTVLSESKNVGIVYHFTSLGRAVKILEQDLLKSNTISRIVSRPTVSTTRDKNYIKNRQAAQIRGNDIGFVLDGTAMSANYKVMPVNDASGFDQAEISWGDEQEEIWYGKKLESDGGIKNIKKFIKKVIITKPGYELITKPAVFNMKQSTIDKDQVISNIADLSQISDNRKKLKLVIEYFKKFGIEVEIYK